MRKRIARIALARLRDLGEPFTCWSLSKLASTWSGRGSFPRISTEALRQILLERAPRS